MIITLQNHIIDTYTKKKNILDICKIFNRAQLKIKVS